MMRLRYEKHRRSYTVLATTFVMDELLSQRLCRYFHYVPHTMYGTVENGVFNHWLAETDYRGYALGWLKNHSLNDLNKLIQARESERTSFQNFVRGRHGNTIAALKKSEEYIRKFTDIIFVAAYVPRLREQCSTALLQILMQTRRKYELVHKIGISHHATLLARFEKERGLGKDTLRYLTDAEYYRHLATGTLPTNIQKRQKKLCVTYGRNMRTVLTGSTAERKIRALYQEIKRTLDVNIISGQCAFGGKASGHARIILHPRDLRSIKNGEILISPMTDPRYLGAIKKSAAIVTDEGGITCHAAIVSRELRVPCVIGTKVATQVLQNGDRIKVDANRGIITKV
ncbi:MAG: PEP-utilizing enzyme [Patescibacteria group bacterium]